MTRQKKVQNTGPKKGRASWAPSKGRLNAKTLPGYEGQRLRWLSKDPANLAKKAEEGWEIASPLKGIQTEHEHPQDIDSGKPLTSLTEYRELVLGFLPEELAKSRDEFINEQTDKTELGLKRMLQKQADEGASDSARKAGIHGRIVIE